MIESGHLKTNFKNIGDPLSYIVGSNIQYSGPREGLDYGYENDGKLFHESLICLRKPKTQEEIDFDEAMRELNRIAPGVDKDGNVNIVDKDGHVRLGDFSTSSH